MTLPTEADYLLTASGDPPPGYPAEYVADDTTTDSFAPTFEARRAAFLEHVRCNPAPPTNKAPYYELIRLAAGNLPHEGIFQAGLDYIDSRCDCADFVLHAFIRLLYQFADHPALSSDLLERVKQTALHFKYWPSEPGIDTLCTWTENHQILFNSAAYLLGQLYPDEVFTNSGDTGQDKMTHTHHRILKWLELRYQTGFSEWLSHVYYDEDLVALLALSDFCHDEEIAGRARQVIDLILLDVALNSYQGVFGSTHGRSYEDGKKWAAREAVADTIKLLFGVGTFTSYDNMSAACFALSPSYRLPRVIYEIAHDLERPSMANLQRHGIRIDEAERWGLHLDNYEDGMVFLSLEAYTHPRTIHLVLRMFDAFNWWENGFFGPFKARRRLLRVMRWLGLLPSLARMFLKDVTRNTREEVNTITLRTPDYLLSTAQDYRPGFGGDQQHIWQATFGPNAVCFTTHPGARDKRSPGYWTGSGTLPRAIQVGNVVIVIYRINTRPGLYHTNRLFYTHAWLPRDQFDEVIEQDGWIFAHKGDGYLAITSEHGYRWQTEPGPDQNREVIADGLQNIWICECGRKDDDGSFQSFVERICAASLSYGTDGVEYHSPTQGHLTFGWDKPLTINDNCIEVRKYPRYNNAYMHADFPARSIAVELGEHTLQIDWDSLQREASSFT